MARNVQLIEIDLRSGITTNDNLYAIGPKTWRTKNAVWGYRYPRLGVDGFFQAAILRQPTSFPNNTTGRQINDATSFRDLGFCQNNIAMFSVGFGCNISNQYGYWGLDAGASKQTELDFATGTARCVVDSTNKIPGCSVYWSNPGRYPAALVTARGDDPDDPADYLVTNPDYGVLVWSHPLAHIEDTNYGHIYYLFDDTDPDGGGADGNGARSLTTDVTLCPRGCAALTVHLDRLWMLTAPIDTLTTDSELWYTDPFDLTTIRAANMLQILGRGTCLIPASFGAIDSTGVPHLIIGCKESVVVLDGDPILGGGLQASLRTISQGVGILNSHAAALTSYGVFLLGTDGDLWLIPPGAQTMIPVGGQIRNHLGINNMTYVVDTQANAAGSLVWFPPYLYIYPGGETGYFYIGEPSNEGIKFWGPMTRYGDTQRRAVIRSPEGFHAYLSVHGDHTNSVHSIDSLPLQTTPTRRFRYLSFDRTTAATGTYPDGSSSGRTAQISTGLINVPGHTIQISKILLETTHPPKTSGNALVTWTVAVTDEKMNSVTAIRTPESSPAYGTQQQYMIATQHFIVPPLPASRGLRITVDSTTESDLSLVRLFAEVRTTPVIF